MLEEHDGVPYIDTSQRGRILSDQRVYGLWGLYTVSSRVSALVPEGPIGVTPPVAQLIEKVYRPCLGRVEPQLLKILAVGGRLDTKGKKPLFVALCSLFPEQLTGEEITLFAHHLRDARETAGAGTSGLQARFAVLLAKHTNLEQRLTRPEAVAMAEAAAPDDSALAERLWRIIRVEALLAPADALFDHILTRNGQTPEQLAVRLEQDWGPRVPNLDPDAFNALLTEVEAASTPVQARAMRDCHTALAAGRYDESIRALIEWNAEVMKTRKSAPWVRLSGSNRLDVRYRGAEMLLPKEEELGTLWHNQYFVNSLKSITHQLGGAV
jgi:hypothetical protein